MISRQQKRYNLGKKRYRQRVKPKPKDGWILYQEMTPEEQVKFHDTVEAVFSTGETWK